MQKVKGKNKDFKISANNAEFAEDVDEHGVNKNNVLDALPAGSTKKKKCSSVCDVPVGKLSEQLTSACSLGVLNDPFNSLNETDFRNMLDSALVPRYKKLDREAQCDVDGRRNSDTDKNLSPVVTHILAEIRRDADASTDKADRESDKMYPVLTKFIKNTDGIKSGYTGKKLLTKSSSQNNGIQDLHTRAHSSGPKLTSKVFNGKRSPECNSIDFGLAGCNGHIQPSNEEEKSIKYIDEDLPSNENSPPREPVQHMLSERDFRSGFTQGNIVQELYPMNEESNDDSQNHGSSIRAATDNIDLESTKIGNGKRMECGENSFICTSGQLRVHGNKHSSYEMTNTLPVIRDSRNYENAQRMQSAGTFFSQTLVPANYKPRELASQFLTPTESARLSPTPVAVPPENDMTNNCKNREKEEKHRLARQRKMNRKAKETKNVIKPECSEGYMGNLATEEILRKLGEEDKGGKAKKNQKSGAITKDASKNSKSSGGSTKKNKEKRSQPEKDIAKGSGESSNSPSPSPKHSMKMNGRISPAGSSNLKEQNEVADLVNGTKLNNEKHSERRSRSSDIVNDKVKVASSSSVTVAVGEDDDEEQYVSADEGVNSVASDEVYHTDELSVSSSHDLMNDAGNYRADDEEVIPNKYIVEEPEFIQVTAKNKKKTSTGAFADKKASAGSNIEKSSSSRQVLSHVEVNQRRNSAQLTVDVGAGHLNQQPSPNDHKKFSGSLGRRQLNSLADYIDDSTVHQSKTRKNSHHSNSKAAGNSSQQFKTAVSQDSSKSKTSAMEALDRRSSQPLCQPGRWAAAVTHNSQGNSTFCVVTTTGARPSSPQSQLVSPALSSASSSTHSFKQKKSLIAYDPSDERANPPLLSLGSSANITDMTNTACVTVTGGNCSTSSTAARSYAEITKSKSPVMASSCASDAQSHSSARDTSPEFCTASTSTANDDRCTSVTSSAGGSVEIIDKDSSGQNTVIKQSDGDNIKASGIDGFSFFYDPNEPTTICDASPLTPEENENSRDFFTIKSDEALAKVFNKEAKLEKHETKQERNGGKFVKSGKQEKKLDRNDAKFDCSENKLIKVEKIDQTRSTEMSINSKKMPILLDVFESGKTVHETGSSIVLKFESGRTLVLPSMNAGGSLEVDRKKNEMMNNAWKSFMENGPTPIRYTLGVLQDVSISNDGDN